MNRSSQTNLTKISSLLVAEYGRPRHGNFANPLDEVIYIILSSQTDEQKYRSVFRALKTRFQSWSQISASALVEIERIIKPAGLSRYKTNYLVGVVEKLRKDFGRVSLASLRVMSDEDAERYLCSLPGVSIKTARCVLMYSLNRQVFPVDTHVFRVLNRLGVISLPQPIRKWHNVVQDVIPDDLRYDLHVTLLSHGREVCRAHKPECHRCNLKRLCAFTKMTDRRL